MEEAGKSSRKGKVKRGNSSDAGIHVTANLSADNNKANMTGSIVNINNKDEPFARLHELKKDNPFEFLQELVAGLTDADGDDQKLTREFKSFHSQEIFEILYKHHKTKNQNVKTLDLHGKLCALVERGTELEALHETGVVKILQATYDLLSMETPGNAERVDRSLAVIKDMLLSERYRDLALNLMAYSVGKVHKKTDAQEQVEKWARTLPYKVKNIFLVHEDLKHLYIRIVGAHVYDGEAFQLVDTDVCDPPVELLSPSQSFAPDIVSPEVMKWLKNRLGVNKDSHLVYPFMDHQHPRVWGTRLVNISLQQPDGKICREEFSKPKPRHNIFYCDTTWDLHAGMYQYLINLADLRPKEPGICIVLLDDSNQGASIDDDILEALAIVWIQRIICSPTKFLDSEIKDVIIQLFIRVYRQARNIVRKIKEEAVKLESLSTYSDNSVEKTDWDLFVNEFNISGEISKRKDSEDDRTWLKMRPDNRKHIYLLFMITNDDLPSRKRLKELRKMALDLQELDIFIKGFVLNKPSLNIKADDNVDCHLLLWDQNSIWNMLNQRVAWVARECDGIGSRRVSFTQLLTFTDDYKDSEKGIEKFFRENSGGSIYNALDLAHRMLVNHVDRYLALSPEERDTWRDEFILQGLVEKD